MSHIFYQFQRFGRTSGSENYEIGFKITVVGFDYILIINLLNFFNRSLGMDFKIFLLNFLQKAIDNGLGRIALRENSSVVFNFQSNVSLQKPFHRITGLKFGKNAQQFLISSCIKLHQFFRIEASVGNITSSTAGNFHFLQNVFILLQNFYRKFIFVQICSAKKSGCPTSDEDCFFQHFTKIEILRVINFSLNFG